MKRNRKRNLANDAKRSRLYRARKLNRQRKANDVVFRERLEEFYQGRHLPARSWVLSSEFFLSGQWASLQQFFDASDIEPVPLASVGSIETGRFVVDGDSVEIIRPKYFLNLEEA